MPPDNCSGTSVFPEPRNHCAWKSPPRTPSPASSQSSQCHVQSFPGTSRDGHSQPPWTDPFHGEIPADAPAEPPQDSLSVLLCCHLLTSPLASLLATRSHSKKLNRNYGKKERKGKEIKPTARICRVRRPGSPFCQEEEWNFQPKQGELMGQEPQSCFKQILL